MASSDTKHLIGSASRDMFKWYHKNHLSKYFWCFDADLVMVEKNPPGIVAVMDFKETWDAVTFSEALGYNAFIERGIPVFLIWSNVLDETNPFTLFSVTEYLGGDWRPNPPKIETRSVLDRVSRHEFEQWETEIRNVYKRNSK
jgi:hypothetical protein